MRSHRRKPTKWDVLLAVGLSAGGLLLALPVFPAFLSQRLTVPLFISGIMILFIIWRQYETYEDLPEEERQDAKYEKQDERSIMIQTRAAWRYFQTETVLMVLGIVLIVLFADDYRVIQGVMVVFWVRVLLYEAIRWWINRKF